MIDIAMRNASRLEEFVADMLMLARLDADELDPIRHVPLDLGVIVDAAVSESAPAAGRHDLVVDLPRRPVTVRGDAAHLKRAVQSLLANAIKYTAEGGRIAVSVSTTPESADVTVLDSGIGIDPEEIPLLGNRFYRGADAHRRAIGGTGLGLAITKTIVERHHGRLRISSTPGEGSRFVISLPTTG
jgi:signal transduction histidine kinase